MIGCPIAIVYLLNGTLRIEHELDNPEEFVSAFRAAAIKFPETYPFPDTGNFQEAGFPRSIVFARRRNPPSTISIQM
jgi:hypothetical protein